MSPCPPPPVLDKEILFIRGDCPSGDSRLTWDYAQEPPLLSVGGKIAASGSVSTSSEMDSPFFSLKALGTGVFDYTPISGYGGWVYRGGSIFYYWDNTFNAWREVDFSSHVITTTNIIAGPGLIGGGDLSNDVILSVDPNYGFVDIYHNGGFVGNKPILNFKDTPTVAWTINSNGNLTISATSLGAGGTWVADENAGGFSLLNLNTLNGIPVSAFLTNPFNRDVLGNNFSLTGVNNLSTNNNVTVGGTLYYHGVPIEDLFGGGEQYWVLDPDGSISSSRNVLINGSDTPLVVTSSTNNNFMYLDSSQWNAYAVRFNGIYGGELGFNASVVELWTTNSLILRGYDSTGRVYFPGAIGIGIINPAYELDVNGSVNANSCYLVNGITFACWNGAAGINLSNIISINGSAPGGFWQSGFGGIIYYNGGNVGIGTNNPTYPLSVVGNVNSTGCYLISGTEFACSDGAGGISLSNVTNINGSAPGGAPAPPIQSVQWNNSGVFGGDANLTWDTDNVILYVQNQNVPEGPTIQVIGTGGYGSTVYLQALDSQGNSIASQVWGTGPEGPTFITHGLSIDSYASRGTYYFPTALMTGDQLFSIFGEGNDGNTNAGGVSIVAVVESDWTATNCAAALTFGTNFQPSSAVFERMRVTSYGNVGIGTYTLPMGTEISIPYGISDTLNTYLTINGGVKDDVAFKNQGCGILELAQSADTTANSNVAVGEIVFTDGGNTQADKRIAYILSVTDSTTAGNRGGLISFGTRPDAGSVPLERMRIKSNGNVGIGGVANPAYRLDVSGDCNLSSGSVYRINGTPLALGQPQTPWAQNVNASNFNLDSVKKLGVGMISPSQAQYTFGVHATVNQNFYVGTTAGGIALWVIDDAAANPQSIVINASDFSFNGTFGAVRMKILSNGNVGIAKDPLWPLDVVGDINISGVYRVNGVPISTGGSGFWQAGSSGAIYYNGGHVGIGVAAPAYTLAVKGNSSEFSGQGIIDIDSTGNAGSALYFSNNGVLELVYQVYAGTFAIGGPSLTPLWLFGAANGNVGIGTTSPSSRLHLQGSEIIQNDADGLISSAGIAQLQIRGNSNTNKNLYVGFDTAANVGVIQAGIAFTGWNNLLLNPQGGNVGIGTTSPGYKLDVNGTSAANFFQGKGGSKAAIISAASPGNDPVYDLPVGIASFAVIVNGTLGTMQFVVSDNLGTSYRSEAFVISPT